MDKKKIFGNLGEDFARSLLRLQGYSILSSNYSSKFGEIDIIALRNQELFFVEVKTRRSTQMGYPSEAVDARKKRHMQLTAMDYLNKTKVNYRRWSFKVIEILVNEIDDLS